MTTLLAGVSLLSSSRADAELGGALSSVMADGGRMGARVNSVAMGGYTRHDLTRGNGAMVHELTNALGRRLRGAARQEQPRGQVFAVTWSGPGKPDLRSLLGARFATFQAANAAGGRTMRALRRPPQVNEADLQIQTAGHMGFFRGVAFIPSLAPAGFSPSDLKQEP